MVFGWIFIAISGVSLLWSFGITWLIFLVIFLYIFLKQWTLCVALFFVWFFLWISSWLLFNKQLLLEPPSIVEWLVTKQTKPDEYELTNSNWTYLLRSNTPIPLSSTIKAQVSKRTVAENIVVTMRDPNFHPIFEKNFSYPYWLFMKGYQWVWYIRSYYLIDEQQSIRKYFTDRLVAIYWWTKEAGLLHGMLVWWRAWFDQAIYEQFIASWLVHIIAVSGSNIALLLLFFSIILFFVPIVLRPYFYALIIIYYGILCWFDSSLLRAICMGLIILFTTLVWIKTDTIRVFRYAMSCMILYNPLMLWYDVWFLLSICSVLWIYRVAKKMPQYWRKRLLYSYIVIPIWAWLGSMPVVYIFMGSFSLQSFLANILVIPLVWPTLWVGILWLTVSHSTITALSTQLLRSIFLISSWFSSWWASITHESVVQTSVVILCIIVLFWIVFVLPTMNLPSKIYSVHYK